MTKNVGKVDKTIRITAGVVLIIMGFLMGDWIIGIIGIVPLLTGIFSWCPLYCPLKISTCSEECSK
jgi:cadmium resistance protein CadD (predicted permease)